ncbi:MAG TPA: SUMF1/EgtB/PvdO family nonheme iron enzyme [Polyangiaceae bacterium]
MKGKARTILLAGLAFSTTGVGCRDAERTTPVGRPSGPTAAIGRPAPMQVGEQAPLTSIAALKTAPSTPTASECADGMTLVDGMYCPDVRLNCKKYLDPKGRYEYFRCADYAPSTCLSKERKHLHFCMDTREYTPAGESLPENHHSWRDGDRICRGMGKRMCLESEWNFACEGEEMRPYPYGFTRDATACNADRDDVVSPQGTLRDLRAPSGSYQRCVSPFGVADMSGNLEEFVTIDHSTPARPAMKGSYWQPGRNFCRAAQTAHDRYYNGTETGFRCCADTP